MPTESGHVARGHVYVRVRMRDKREKGGEIYLQCGLHASRFGCAFEIACGKALSWHTVDWQDPEIADPRPQVTVNATYAPPVGHCKLKL